MGQLKGKGKYYLKRITEERRRNSNIQTYAASKIL